jgi:naphthoate synthase
MDAAGRRLARVAAHLAPSSFPVTHAAAPPLVPAPTAASSSSSSPAGDSYRRVHGDVSAEPPEWRAATDESGKEFVDIIYEKSVNEGIAKVTSSSFLPHIR